MSSDAGLILLRKIERKVGLARSCLRLVAETSTIPVRSDQHLPHRNKANRQHQTTVGLRPPSAWCYRPTWLSLIRCVRLG